MALSVGDRLGPYEILAPLGAGGMGVVYKARDTRLERSVAIKVLPGHIANREDARARFEREARTVASLNHPHICTLFDIGPNYMVMELIEGETLAVRIAKGALPLDQAIPFATQIADALDRAHRAGVTHRDVKPGNIMLTRDGAKVLDFGLAKSAATPGPTEETLTQALTLKGAIIGTPQYMAPEQFSGQEADARSDIWAFGAVLYEMVTARKAFEGKSYQSLVAAVLTAQPAAMDVKPLTPAWLERLVRRCLQKEPEDRYQSIRDAVLDLKSPPLENPAPKSSRWPWIAGAAALLGLLAVSIFSSRRVSLDPPVLNASIDLPEKSITESPAISPDGKLLAFVVTKGGKRQLWVRPLSAPVAQPLPNTDGAVNPFWSPDSRWIGFEAKGGLKKIDAAGGPAQELCKTVYSSGAAWTSDGFILFAESGKGLFQVPEQGGDPALVVPRARAKGEYALLSPVSLPSRRYLFTIRSANENATGIYLGTRDSPERKRLVGDLSAADHATGPSGESYLLFLRQGTLMAQRLNIEKGAVEDKAFAVAQNVRRFSAATNGMLIYEKASEELSQLTWTDREGRKLDAVGEPASGLFRLGLSPSGKHVAYDLERGGNADIWVQEPGGVAMRFTFRAGREAAPVWSPDGTRIAFTADGTIYVKNANGGGAEEAVHSNEYAKVVTDWGAGGNYLLYSENQPNLRDDIWLLPMDGQRKPMPFLRTEFHERQGAFAPDGKWIAYTSDESGQDEVYVQPFPATNDARWQVSRGGGHWPRWRRDGRELYWLREDGTLMMAEVSSQPVFRAGTLRTLFDVGVLHPFERFAVSADGQRFLAPRRLDQGQQPPLTLLVNWLAAAKR